MTSRCQSSLPSARWKHMTERFSATACPPAEEPPAKFSGTLGGHLVRSLAWVRKMRSPQMIGVEFPADGKATFQRTFSVTVHLTGKSFSPDTPAPAGPRQLGQFSALAEACQLSNNSSNRKLDRMSGPFAKWCQCFVTTKI